MAYCSQCDREYPEGTEKCETCGAPLRSSAGPSKTEGSSASGAGDVPLVRIRSFSGPASVMQAELARNILQEQSIPCILQGHMMGEILPGVEPINMLVREDDAAAADEILRAFLEKPEPAA